MHNYENGMFISNNIRTAMMQPCTLEYVLPVHFRFQVACPIVKKKKRPIKCKQYRNVTEYYVPQLVSPTDMFLMASFPMHCTALLATSGGLVMGVLLAWFSPPSV